MNTISKEKTEILERCFREGMSVRRAATEAGVSKLTAGTFRLKNGGMPHYRELGAKFKSTRWEWVRK